MGKYMRSKRGGAGAGDGSMAAPAAVLGVRTRSRSAATTGVAKRKKQAEAMTAQAVDEAVSGHESTPGHDDGAGCYLHLRSRRLFMPAVVAPRGDQAPEKESSTVRLDGSGAPEGAVVVRISRCSSTASSTMEVAARERSGGEAEASEGRDVESSVSDSECCDGRERKETTPSSRPPVDSSDLESNQATNDEHRRKRCCRRTPATATTSTAAALHLESRARMPAAEEIEQFFAAAEKAQAERFAAKYNFDVALGVPLNAGRFEWTPVATI